MDDVGECVADDEGAEDPNQILLVALEYRVALVVRLTPLVEDQVPVHPVRDAECYERNQREHGELLRVDEGKYKYLVAVGEEVRNVRLEIRENLVQLLLVDFPV